MQSDAASLSQPFPNNFLALSQYTFSSFYGRNSDGGQNNGGLFVVLLNWWRIIWWMEEKVMEDQTDGGPLVCPPQHFFLHQFVLHQLFLHHFFPPSIRFSSISLPAHQIFLHQMRKTTKKSSITTKEEKGFSPFWTPLRESQTLDSLVPDSSRVVQITT